VEYRTQFFQRDKDVIVLLGRCQTAGRERIPVLRAQPCGGQAAAMDLKLEKQCRGVPETDPNEAGALGPRLSEGGWRVSAESCVSGPRLRRADRYSIIDEQCLRHDCVLFGETQSRIVLSAAPEALLRFCACCARTRRRIR
jgi:hypothetical protein